LPLSLYSITNMWSGRCKRWYGYCHRYK